MVKTPADVDKMPVRWGFEDFGLLEDYDIPCLHSPQEEWRAESPPLDVWQKFDLPTLEAPWTSSLLEDGGDGGRNLWDLSRLMRHDCMWAGDVDTPKSLSSESEEESDDAVVDVSKVTGQIQQTTRIPSPTPAPHHTDHSYHNSGIVCTDNLGVQTPSDSEDTEEDDDEDEEIDVVSVRERSPARRCISLPNNPTIYDRKKLQITMATAMKKRPASVDRRRNSKSKRHKHHHRSYKTDGTAKRSIHNNMERQRRIDLRNLVSSLRDIVPVVADQERAAKVVILREAANYIHELETVDRQKTLELAELRRIQVNLRSHLSHLRRSLAASGIFPTQ